MESSWSLSVPKLYSIYHLVAPPPLPTTPGHFILVSWHWQPSPVLLPGKFHGHRSLVGCSPWGRKESDTTEWLHFHFSLSCIEKEMATHSSVLAWRILGTGEPGGLPSMGSHRVGHDWSDIAAAAAELLAGPFFFFLSLLLSWLCIKTKIKVEVTEI